LVVEAASVREPEGGFFLLKRALVLAVLLLLCAAAFGQATEPTKPPFLTVFAGYSYANQGYLLNSRSNLHGYGVSVEGWHFFPHLTMVGDGHAQFGWNAFPISCVTTGVLCNNGVPPDSRVQHYDFLGGPQYRFTPYGRWQPFVHVLGGAGRATMKTTGFFEGSWAWEVAGGGGVDYRWRGPFDLRVQADYVRTNLFHDTQNCIRASTGLVIRF